MDSEKQATFQETITNIALLFVGDGAEEMAIVASLLLAVASKSAAIAAVEAGAVEDDVALKEWNGIREELQEVLMNYWKKKGMKVMAAFRTSDENKS